MNAQSSWAYTHWSCLGRAIALVAPGSKGVGALARTVVAGAERAVRMQSVGTVRQSV